MHSTPFAEIAAHACGLAAGLGAYVIAGHFTNDHGTRIKVAMTVSVICNAIVGGHINFLMKDFFSLILVRPLSAYLGARLMQYVTSGMA